MTLGTYVHAKNECAATGSIMDQVGWQLLIKPIVASTQLLALPSSAIMLSDSLACFKSDRQVGCADCISHA